MMGASRGHALSCGARESWPRGQLHLYKSEKAVLMIERTCVREREELRRRGVCGGREGMAHWRRELRSEHPTLRDGGRSEGMPLRGLGERVMPWTDGTLLKNTGRMLMVMAFLR